MFTFLVISYNEEDVIVQTLESIRHQIVQYSGKEEIQLIIADDGSKDHTTDVVDDWIERNKKLFSEVTKIYHKNNVGTSKNYATAVREIHGAHFISLAGDDLLPANDLFGLIRENETVDIIAGGILMFQDGRILEKDSHYMDIFAQSIVNHKYLRWAMKLGCPIQAGAIWTKELVNEADLKFTEQFKLLEDRSRYYRIAMKKKAFTYKYVNQPVLLYRKSNSSVSSGNQKYLKMLNQDMARLYLIGEHETQNPFMKIAFLFQYWAVHLRGNKKVGILRYATPYFFVEQIRRGIFYKKFENLQRELIGKYKIQNQQLYDKVSGNNENTK